MFNPMSDEKPITPDQSRGARAMLGWSREQLAQQSGVANATLADFEAGKRTPYNRTLADVRRALEEGGIEFIPENGGGPGARLKKRAVGAAGESKSPLARRTAPPRMMRGRLSKTRRKAGG
jgi:transcriptional regulator with XRE-family HTH domain